MRLLRASLGSLAIVCLAPLANAATYQVGPRRPLADLAAVAPLLRPGDVVEVDGGATYPGDVVFKSDGAASAKIRIVGHRVNDKRPVLLGGKTTVELRASHYVLEGFEITGGESRCVFHHADDITIRDVIIHDCGRHGILGADDESGSLTLDYVEVYASGRGDGGHAIYVATDEKRYPKSIFRMQHCYLHDENGGNAVKSRAERNEIAYNWIEGALHHELELVGPEGEDEGRAREDSDVVGNVFKKNRGAYQVRIGGDGTGDTSGRYRFVNNTFLMSSDGKAVFRLFDKLESVEMHNNVIARVGGGPVQILQDADVKWSTGKPVIAGRNNWIPSGSTKVPIEWTATLIGADPMFTGPRDPRPRPSSPLLSAGADSPSCAAPFEFPSPLPLPEYLPPLAVLERAGSAALRARKAAIDIGAFGSPLVVPTPMPKPEAPSETPRGTSVAFPRLRRGCACTCTTSDGPEDADVWHVCLQIAALAALVRRRYDGDR